MDRRRAWPAVEYALHLSVSMTPILKTLAVLLGLFLAGPAWYLFGWRRGRAGNPTRFGNATLLGALATVEVTCAFAGKLFWLPTGGLPIYLAGAGVLSFATYLVGHRAGRSPADARPWILFTAALLLGAWLTPQVGSAFPFLLYALPAAFTVVVAAVTHACPMSLCPKAPPRAPAAP